MRLENKVALITGGGSGIGRESTFRFVEEGASVVIADLNRETGEATLEQARERGIIERVRFVATDVSKEEDIQRAVETAVAEFGRLDCMFNNAGIPGALGPLEEMDVADWDFTFAVLVRGPFLGLKHAARQFKKQGTGGVVLHTSSVSSLVGAAGPRAYAVAKAAVSHMAKVAAVDMAAYRIRVNAIAPGPILTEITGKDPVAAAKRLLGGHPWPDNGLPKDIADAAVFLASDNARFITGQTLFVDGGASADSSIERRLGRGDEWSTISGLHHGTTGEKSKIRRLAE